MRHYQPRKSDRMPVNMTLISSSLPAPPAQLTNLSDEGARIKLSVAPEHNLQNAMIPTKVSLPCHNEALFEGTARVIWTQGSEMGLQWTAPTAKSWQLAKAMLLG